MQYRFGRAHLDTLLLNINGIKRIEMSLYDKNHAKRFDEYKIERDYRSWLESGDKEFCSSRQRWALSDAHGAGLHKQSTCWIKISEDCMSDVRTSGPAAIRNMFHVKNVNGWDPAVIDIVCPFLINYSRNRVRAVDVKFHYLDND